MKNYSKLLLSAVLVMNIAGLQGSDEAAPAPENHQLMQILQNYSTTLVNLTTQLQQYPSYALANQAQQTLVDQGPIFEIISSTNVLGIIKALSIRFQSLYNQLKEQTYQIINNLPTLQPYIDKCSDFVSQLKSSHNSLAKSFFVQTKARKFLKSIPADIAAKIPGYISDLQSYL